MVRTLLLAAGLASVISASVITANHGAEQLDGIIDVCYEDHPKRTVASYAFDGESVVMVDHNKNGVLDPDTDRIVVIGSDTIRRYDGDGYLETKLVLVDGRWRIGSNRFFCAYYRAGERILENDADREGYAAARDRFASESAILARIEHDPARVVIDPPLSCDPYRLLTR
jgi:hypothetical protein